MSETVENRVQSFQREKLLDIFSFIFEEEKKNTGRVIDRSDIDSN